MKEQLKKFEHKKPEVVFEWSDAETGAEGWVVINSLRGGAAGGGTRMRKGLDKREVESLAKTMEIKFTVAGPAIGGAKSGINFDPDDPRKKEVLQRWYKAVKPLLKNYYGTGGDMNVDEIHDVIPITESLGILHPQEGIVNGHFNADAAHREKSISNLKTGVKKIISDTNYSPDVIRKYVVADMITGYGVAIAVKHFYTIYGGNVTDKKVIVQGWGNVGSAAAFYMAQMGAKVVGIIDRNGGLLNENGFSFEEIKNLFLNKKGNLLVSEKMIPFDEINAKIWDIKADVFLPCAASRLISEDQLNRMIKAGVEVISAGANVPFSDPEIFFGNISEKADKHLSMIPDFIANCGMARVFAYMMEKNAVIEDKNIFEDVSKTIETALKKTHSKNTSKTDIAKTAFEIALNELKIN
jgi:glutamate dehydrogenase/leucine dehydrogenase